MRLPRIALSIRAQLLLVLTVFLALPWLGVSYVRELERLLRDAQERTLAGTAQAVATALHDRPRLFATRPDGIAAFAQERTDDAAKSSDRAPLSASPEVAQIIDGLSRTTARIWVIDRDGTVLARAGSLKAPPSQLPAESFGARLSRATTGRLYALVLDQPSEDFADDAADNGTPGGRDVEGALAGILTTERRPTSDAKAVVVSAAHPIWVGDSVKGAVIVEETGNAVLAQRNLAFERLFNIVLAVLLVGSLALTLYATWLSSRIRRLRDDAELAIDEQGRVRAALASSNAGDEIGDLSRSFASVLARLSDYASYQEKMAGRLSHELRTPIAVVRSSLDNLKQTSLPDDARVYMVRAQEGLARLTTILTRMTEAARLEQSLSESERERFDVANGRGGLRGRISTGVSRGVFCLCPSVSGVHSRGRARPHRPDARQARRQRRRVRQGWSHRHQPHAGRWRRPAVGQQRRASVAGNGIRASVRFDGLGPRRRRRGRATPRAWPLHRAAHRRIPRRARAGGEPARRGRRRRQRNDSAAPLKSRRA
jgi:hypothetical protein